MTNNTEIRNTMKTKLEEEINSLNRSIREIIECSSLEIVSAETALAMRDHIDEKITQLRNMYDALKKADRICQPPVTGPMARKIRGPVEELTEADKALIMNAYNKYYPEGCPV